MTFKRLSLAVLLVAAVLDAGRADEQQQDDGGEQQLSEAGQQARYITGELDHYHHHKKPQYGYKYGVHDKKTGDVKDAWEHRDGDVTKGGYSLVEPDGHTRVVEYIVTKKGGFQATVKRLPPHHHHH